MGDSGEENQYFCLGIKNWILKKIKQSFSEILEEMEGYAFSDYDRTPYIPLIPFYRYDKGLVIEYTYDDDCISRKKFDTEDNFGFGNKIKYRKWESAEAWGMKEKYITMR